MIRTEKGQTIYFLGIGGIAMAQAALLLKEMGYEVKGSDTSLYPPTDRLLQEGGIIVKEGYDPAHLCPRPDMVVIGNAISRGNPEVETILEEGIPYLSLPELIRRMLLSKRRSMVVAGTHGKTTTASLLAWLMFRAGLDPSFLIGGIPINFGRGVHLGRGDWVVLEGDEYDSAFFDKRPKFLHYLPGVIILNNIEYDHADIYRNLEEVKLSFRRLIDVIPPEGIIVACADDEAVGEVICKAPCRVETFGAAGKWSPKGVKVTQKGINFRLQRGKEELGEFGLPLWGEHNLRNALGAVVAAYLIGLPLPEIQEGLRTFQGVRRRMEVVGKARGVTVIDDFAHHPTAVRAVLQAARSRFPGRRLWAIFEPRTQTMRRGILQGELALALGEADRAVIGKVPLNSTQEGLDPQRLVQQIRGVKGDAAAIYLEDPRQIIVYCVEEVARGDVILVMSSGYFAGLPWKILDALKNSA